MVIKNDAKKVWENIEKGLSMKEGQKSHEKGEGCSLIDTK